MERWIRVADLDGFSLVYMTTPGTFEEVDDLLVSELRRRGTYPEARDEERSLTAWEKIYGKGQSGLRADHVGARYKYDVYKENILSEQWKEEATERIEGNSRERLLTEGMQGKPVVTGNAAQDVHGAK